MIRILIVDDQNLVREGIKVLLEKTQGIKIVGDFPDGKRSLENIETLKPDIVLLDIDMPGINGLETANKIRYKLPEVKIIILSGSEEEEYVRKATSLGAKGYLLKGASSQELEWSIKLVYQGYSVIKSELLEQQLPQNTEPESDSEFDLDLDLDLSLDEDSDKENLDDPKKQDLSPKNVLSEREQANLDRLEHLLARNQVQQNYSSFQQQRRKKSLFYRTNFTRIKKTKSLNLKLLVFIILFSLGFLVFIALS